jgi:hypothetical protein
VDALQKPGMPSKRVTRRRPCLERRPVRAAKRSRVSDPTVRTHNAKRAGGAVPPAQVPMSNETRGRTGSRDDLPAEQGGGSGPWEVKPEVAT